MSFCLDTNVFIQAHRVRYPMDFAPGFWDGLVTAAQSGELLSIHEVYSELSKSTDDLAAWAKTHRTLIFKNNNDPATQQAMVRVGVEIEARVPKYTEPAKEAFLSGADPWLIAFCLAHGHTLVTEEVGDPRQITKVRIPDICAPLRVSTVPMVAMLRPLKLRLISG